MRKKIPFYNCAVAVALKSLCALGIFGISIFPFTAAGQVQLLKDANPSELTYVNEYSWLTRTSSSIYFVSHNELWKSNGTPAGTIRLKTFKSISDLTSAGAALYFVADDGASGSELWKSDGTAAGTVRVRDIIPGANGSQPTRLVWSGSLLFFAAYTPASGLELWKSNGTSSGTVMVKDINPGSASGTPMYLTNLNGTVYFQGRNAANGIELWKSNGVSSGTVLVKDIIPGSGSSYPGGLTAVNGTLYFSASDASGNELWKSSGTAAGTVRVKDIRPGTGGSGPWNLTNVNGILYFSANNGTHGRELWKSNGTSTGTIMVKDMNPGAGGLEQTDTGMGGGPDNFTNINGVLYFTASQGTQNYIARSDGTAAGTVRIQTVPGVNSSAEEGINFPYPIFTYLNGNVYYFNGDPAAEVKAGANWYYLWKLPYKGSGLTKVKMFYRDGEFYEGPTVTKESMIAFNGALYMTGRINTGGYEFIKSDGTTAGTVTVKDTYAPTNHTHFREMTSAPNGLVYWRSYGSGATQDLWRTDGTTAGTYKLSAIADRADWLVIGNYLYFVKPGATSATWTLYKTQGTAATTVPVYTASYSSPPDDPSPIGFTSVNGILYFYNNLGEVWKSGGTSSTTSRLRDFYLVRSIYNGGGGRLIISVLTEGFGMEIWKHDAGGTSFVKTVRTGNAPRAYTDASVVINNVLYFQANDGVHGNEVWRTDGTPAGTRMLADLNTGDAGAINVDGDIMSMATDGTRIFVSGYEGDEYSNAWRLWNVSLSDGSFSTMELPSSFVEMAVMNNKVYGWGHMTSTSNSAFYMVDLANTEAGAEMLLSYPGNGLVTDLNRVNDIFYWSVENGGGIMRSDGTKCGTITLSTGLVGPKFPLEPLGNSLVFSGRHPYWGQEPYIYRNASSVATPCAAMAAEEPIVQTTSTGEVLTPYPNPFTSGFTMRVKGDDDEVSHVSVHTSTGHPVEQFKNIKANVDYENIGQAWAPGIYIVKVHTKKGVATHMVVKK